MATIKLQGNSSGSGSVTLTAPNTNSARTITLPDQDVDLGSLGGAGSIEAWVNFNGTGAVSINASGNVSSITDNGTGQYTVFMGNAMSAITFGYALSGRSALSGHLLTDVSQRYGYNNTTSSLVLGSGEGGGNNSGGRYNDAQIVSGIVIQ